MGEALGEAQDEALVEASVKPRLKPGVKPGVKGESKVIRVVLRWGEVGHCSIIAWYRGHTGLPAGLHKIFFVRDTVVTKPKFSN